LGDLLLVSGDVRDALRAYETALQFGASVTITRRKVAKAQQIIASAGEPADDGRPPRKQMAFAEEIRTAEQFEKDGDPRSAEAIYRKILKTDPDHVEASRLLAGSAAAQEQFQEAEVFL
jgi:cytochrome c-type biogenesis protein CcmH/NrfG